MSDRVLAIIVAVLAAASAGLFWLAWRLRDVEDNGSGGWSAR